jgi:hypothetical protein
MFGPTDMGDSMHPDRRTEAKDRAEATGQTVDDLISENPLPKQIDWGAVIPEEDWKIYKKAIEIARSVEVPFLLAGAFGLAAYTQRWRNTKDLDLLVVPEDRQRLIDALLNAGFEDYYPTLAYDRGWIFRSIREGCLVDVIWAMPNRRAIVEADWFDHGRPTNIRGTQLHAVGAEELVWQKIYVLQRDRCDWPDLFNLIYAAGPEIDWKRVLERLDCDKPLLAGLLRVFSWLCPGRTRELPGWLKEELQITEPGQGDSASRRCLDLLDTRPWFAALQPADRPLQL